MRIAYIVEPRKVIGGGVRAAMNLSKSMYNLNNAETAIFGIYEGTVEDAAVNFFPVKTMKPMSLSYLTKYHEFIKKYKPDVVHCLGLFTALVCLLYRKLFHANYSVVCTVHRVTMNMRYRVLIKYVVNYIARNVDYTTFLTEYQKNHYYRNVGFRPQRFTIVPNVIFVQHISSEEKVNKRKSLCRELNTDYITSYVGRIIPSKNIEDTIKIIAIANERGFNLGGVLVGGYSDDYYKILQQLIDELKIGHKIKFVGYVNNPSLYTGAADFTTTTTHGEALPNLLIESFALGKVTFSSDIPQMVDLIDDKKNGFTISLDNLNTFVDEMQKFCSDTELRNQMEQSALQTYNEKYSPERVTAVYNNIYMSL